MPSHIPFPVLPSIHSPRLQTRSPPSVFLKHPPADHHRVSTAGHQAHEANTAAQLMHSSSRGRPTPHHPALSPSLDGRATPCHWRRCPSPVFLTSRTTPCTKALFHQCLQNVAGDKRSEPASTRLTSLGPQESPEHRSSYPRLRLQAKVRQWSVTI